MPTLLDVAKVAGVGVMSVSRVVNGTRKVSAETERKVRDAIDRIGYVPNEAARILKGQRARIVGLVVPDLADNFFAACANTVQTIARAAGYLTLMAASSHREDIEREETEIMLQRQVAGLLVIPSGTRNDHFLVAKKKGVPIVSLDRPLDHVDTDAFLVDNRPASRLATEHLIAHGHRDILCIADEDRIFTKAERVAGYTQAVRDAGLSGQVGLVGPMSGTLSDLLTSALRSAARPTAIFATSNVLATGAFRQLQKRNISIPDGMALISFDDFEAATLVRPEITAIRQPMIEMAERGASLLLERISQAGPAKISQVVLPTELIIRQSCGCKTANT